MDKISASRLMIEIFTCLMCGDEQRARELVKKLDEAELRLLHNRGNDLAKIAETEYFTKRASKREWKL